MYRQYSSLYRYSACIYNIGTYSDPYTSEGTTLVIYNLIFLKGTPFHKIIVPDIIKFTNVTVLTLTTVYFEYITQYYTLVLCYHIHVHVQK